MSEIVRIFDTTLRDGEQSPGVNLSAHEKVLIAEQLVRLGVDIIEAGFPISSPGDLEAVRQVANTVKGVVVAALARANKADIDAAWEAVKGAEQPMIHTFISTSDLHIHYKLRKTRDEVLEAAEQAVRYAKQFTEEVEFSAEDASRTDPDYLCKVYEVAINAGATVINVPDTVGYAEPNEFSALIRTLYERVPNIHKAVVSVHCHDDLGLATANTLAAIREGVGQVEVTINGIGERAGNTSLEEVVMALATKPAAFNNRKTRINTRELVPTSKLVSQLTGMVVQPNKAIVGANAFAHEAGIHQDGVLKNPLTYEIMTPESVGWQNSKIVLGKHSGRHGFASRLSEMGIQLSPEELDIAYNQFKRLTDERKHITDDDLVNLIKSVRASRQEVSIT
ncbi:pyruvate carboxyltransferase [Thermobaculum terrenum ATCC BAA-798]|uniref:2-isopropylmalate synthase n=1 Tax=Thermobaculum terrenum (strain ATCC BAA-798 / CCMEE 7001 / YNP1) TaxID=525904 RepID=D1CDV6_THET1|nr:pyruvate carboxyltransferase [Thermobaculum terrenum ATCC BAA-798]